MSLDHGSGGSLGSSGTPCILITGGALAPEAMALLEEHAIYAHRAPPYSSPADVADLAAKFGVEGIIHRTGSLTADAIAASARLKVIAKHGSGVDNIDLAAASARGVPVMRTLFANAQSVAEHTLALSFALLKGLFPLDRAVKTGEWPKSGYRGRDVAGSVLGIVGFGAIGREVAVRARMLGMDVLVFDPVFPTEASEADVTRVVELEELLAAADIVTLHCPLTAATTHMIGPAQLAYMRPTAFLVNAARGGLVDEAALVEALRQETIMGAGLDTFEREPPAGDNPLWSLPNVITTPHVAGASAGAVRNMGVQAVQHVIDVIQGRGPDERSVANPEYRASRMGAPLA